MNLLKIANELDGIDNQLDNLFADADGFSDFTDLDDPRLLSHLTGDPNSGGLGLDFNTAYNKLIQARIRAVDRASKDPKLYRWLGQDAPIQKGDIEYYRELLKAHQANWDKVQYQPKDFRTGAIQATEGFTPEENLQRMLTSGVGLKDARNNRMRMIALSLYHNSIKNIYTSDFFKGLQPNEKSFANLDYYALLTLPPQMRKLIPVSHRITNVARMQKTKGWSIPYDYNLFTHPDWSATKTFLPRQYAEQHTADMAGLAITAAAAPWTAGGSVMAYGLTGARLAPALFEIYAGNKSLPQWDGKNNRLNEYATKMILHDNSNPQYDYTLAKNNAYAKSKIITNLLSVGADATGDVLNLHNAAKLATGKNAVTASDMFRTFMEHPIAYSYSPVLNFYSAYDTIKNAKEYNEQMKDPDKVKKLGVLGASGGLNFYDSAAMGSLGLPYAYNSGLGINEFLNPNAGKPKGKITTHNTKYGPYKTITRGNETSILPDDNKTSGAYSADTMW